MLGAWREIIDAPLIIDELLITEVLMPPHKCVFLLMNVLQDLTQSISSLTVTKDTVTVCHRQFWLHFSSINFLNYLLTIFCPII